MWEKIQHEPVAMQALIQTMIAMICAFGVKMNGQQIAAVLAVTQAILALVARQMVTPNAKLLPKGDV